MPESSEKTPVTNDVSLPPPAGDSAKADKYIKQLTNFIIQDKVTVIHTDLSRFDPSALEDHFRIDLTDYQVEISHTKDPNTGEDVYVLLFNNLKQIREGCSEKSILAYMYLDASQFQTFKQAVTHQQARIKQLVDEKRFQQAMTPIDAVLNNINSEPAKPLDTSHMESTMPETQENPHLNNTSEDQPDMMTHTPVEHQANNTVSSPDLDWPPRVENIAQQEDHDPWRQETISTDEHQTEPQSWDYTSQPHPMDNYLSSASTNAEKMDEHNKDQQTY